MRRRVAPLLVACTPWLAGAACAEERPPDPGGVVTANRLAAERSPYLRQHATNPVDWHPWGAEAFERARVGEKPVFLSVGYAACHWCHVMEHESFEDAATADLLNQTFVCVKVDREERPDVDALYMQAVHAISGRGGWPMTVLLTPEGDPFWAGTYLPRPALQDLTRRVAQAWSADRARVRAQAAQIAELVRALSGAPDLPAFEGGDRDLLRVLLGALGASFDSRFGGYGTRPKFPPHAELLFLTDRGGANGGEAGLAQVRRTLEAMAQGGIHDHVGGGFHRYSTDERWLLPHFEKMLYDNALLAQAYAAFHEITGEAPFAEVARRTLDWVRREMARPGGGYASSLDADTDGEEGLTYTWTLDEVRAALPPEDAALALRLYGLSESGNFSDEATGRATGRNVIHHPVPPAASASGEALPAPALRARVAALEERLLAARALRPQPRLDDKVITAWNGLLLSAFARVGRVLGDAAMLEDGRRLASFLLRESRRDDGTLLRFPRGSGPEIPGFCEDHVHLADGLLDLAEATGEERWTQAARDLADALLARFEDAAGGGFWTAAEGVHEALLARRKENADTPIPSDNAVAARVLMRLLDRTGEARYGEAADRTLAAWRPLMAQARTATLVAALHRALADRLALAEAGRGAPPPGDAAAERDPVRIDAFLERDAVRLGGRVEVAIRIRLAPSWHVNAVRPSRPELVPTALETPAGAPALLVDVAWPAPAERVLGSDAAPVALYEGEVWVRGALAVPAGVPPGPRKVPLVLRYQPCNEASCLAPDSLRVELALRFGDEDGPARHPHLFGR